MLVLKLGRKGYVASVESGGGRVRSTVLPGFELDVDEIFGAAEFED